MKEFLKSVAEHYFLPIAQQPQGEQDWLLVTDYLFVFPSRRASLFFSDYLLEIRNLPLSSDCPEDRSRFVPLFAPDSLTIGDLFSRFSDSRIANRTQLLFLLYRVYGEVIEEERQRLQREGGSPVQSQIESFDSFIFWGEMLLNDFADVDRYLVDARQVFSNVRDLKELEGSMGGPLGSLSEEARAALRTFWKNINPESHTSDIKSRFVHTWSVLFEIYTRFRKVLSEQGLAYDGMLQREVVEQIREERLNPAFLDRLPQHIVFVGITAIDEAERQLMLWLKQQGRAEFCWDYADSHLRVGDKDDLLGQLASHASFFTKRNLEDFGNALSDDELLPHLVAEEDRRIELVAVASSVGQTNKAASILRDWGAGRARQTAVVLADEHLLVPMCYNVPAQFGEYNVTMGYSLRNTQAYAFVEALNELQRNCRPNARTFYYKPVLALLGHSFMMHNSPDEAVRLSSDILRKGQYQVPADTLQSVSPLFAKVFVPVSGVEGTKNYLKEIFGMLLAANTVDEDASEFTDDGADSSSGMTDLERECLYGYAQQLDELIQLVDQSQIDGLTSPVVYRLLQRLASGRSISFSGEPLSGLQLMGILETRALDFERILLLSMNEGIFPSKPSQNSFIPMSLRNAFGLPTQRHKDSVVAYHFYRLLSRASQVTLLYDSRSPAEPSRYLLQLEYLGKKPVIKTSVDQRILTEETSPISVRKDETVMKKLRQFCQGGNRSLSATSLKTFISCPLQFYLSTVEALHEENDLTEEIADNVFGDILHKTMEYIYEQQCGKSVHADYLKMLCDSGRIQDYVNRAFEDKMDSSERNGYIELILKLVEQYVKCILTFDAGLNALTYLCSEGRQNVVYQVDDQLSVKLTAVYDRLDIEHHDNGNAVLRVVDYKTGKPGDKLNMSDICDLFSDKGKGSKEAFQVLFYCLMLKYADQNTLTKFGLYPQRKDNHYDLIQPHLYFTRMFMGEKPNTMLSINKNTILRFSEVEEAFEGELKNLLHRIFNPDIPFTQAEDSHSCGYCAFRQLCGR